MESLWDWIAENLASFGITKIYLTCAVTGGSVMLAQFGLSMFGIGGESDVDMDVQDIDISDPDALESGGGLQLLSIRTVSGFLTMFGLVGWAGTASGWSPVMSAGIAFLAGLTTMVALAWSMQFFQRLSQSGTANPNNAVGKVGSVYLRIPAAREGMGKVTVSVDGRSMELNAVTDGEELATGSACRVVAQVTSDTFAVAPLEKEI